MTGTLTHLLTKAKHLQGQMDGIFVSSRVAQVLSEPGFRTLCRDKHSVVAVETAKFLVALRTDTQQALTAKEEELAVQNGFKRIPGMRTSQVVLLYTNALLTRRLSCLPYSARVPQEKRRARFGGRRHFLSTRLGFVPNTWHPYGVWRFLVVTANYQLLCRYHVQLFTKATEIVTHAATRFIHYKSRRKSSSSLQRTTTASMMLAQ
jgi:hypothetical protein